MKVGIIKQEEARDIGNQIGLNWAEVDLKEFTLGLNMELAMHKHDPTKHLTQDTVTTGKIVWAHIKLLPNYYSSFKKKIAAAR